MPWLIVLYQPVGLFSLKHGEATSTGGKSLLLPTPFAIRMAILDAAIRTQGVKEGELVFEWIKSLRLALKPPAYAAISGVFGKILKPERHKDTDRAMTPTIAFREYVFLRDEIGIALHGDDRVLQHIGSWLAQVTYFGRRGSFFQLLSKPIKVDTEQIPANFVPLEGTDIRSANQLVAFPLGLLQRMDDWGPEMTFQKANVYQDEPIKLTKDRIRFDVIFPYHLVKAGRGFTFYKCMAP